MKCPAHAATALTEATEDRASVILEQYHLCPSCPLQLTMEIYSASENYHRQKFICMETVRRKLNLKPNLALV